LKHQKLVLKKAENSLLKNNININDDKNVNHDCEENQYDPTEPKRSLLIHGNKGKDLIDFLVLISIFFAVLTHNHCFFWKKKQKK
jgi:hypothetical protein